MNITQSPAVGLFNAIACVALLALVAWSELHPTHSDFHALPEIRQNVSFGGAWEATEHPHRMTKAQAILYVFGG